MNKTVIIGGGAAGMMAAVSAAQSGCEVLLLEKNEKLGKKIYITGKGRCNFTNACDAQEFSDNVMRNPRFFYSAFHAFSNYDAMAFFEENGMPVKVERGGRAFPVSDHASDVTKALTKRMQELHVKIRLKTEAAALETAPYQEEKKGKKGPSRTAKVTAVITSSGERIACDTVIVATGGLSYPTTGSTGDGYRFAKTAGHTVTRLVPSLVSLTTEETWTESVSGLTLKNIAVRFQKDGTVLYEDFGELLFTHKGVMAQVEKRMQYLLAGIDPTVRRRRGEREAPSVELPSLELGDYTYIGTEDIVRSYQVTDKASGTTFKVSFYLYGDVLSGWNVWKLYTDKQ